MNQKLLISVFSSFPIVSIVIASFFTHTVKCERFQTFAYELFEKLRDYDDTKEFTKYIFSSPLKDKQGKIKKQNKAVIEKHENVKGLHCTFSHNEAEITKIIKKISFFEDCFIIDKHQYTYEEYFGDQDDKNLAVFDFQYFHEDILNFLDHNEEIFAKNIEDMKKNLNRIFIQSELDKENSETKIKEHLTIEVNKFMYSIVNNSCMLKLYTEWLYMQANAAAKLYLGISKIRSASMLIRSMNATSLRNSTFDMNLNEKKYEYIQYTLAKVLKVADMHVDYYSKMIFYLSQSMRNIKTFESSEIGFSKGAFIPTPFRDSDSDYIEKIKRNPFIIHSKKAIIPSIMTFNSYTQ